MIKKLKTYKSILEYTAYDTFHKWLRPYTAIALHSLYYLLKHFRQNMALKCLMAAHRYYSNKVTEKAIKQALPHILDRAEALMPKLSEKEMNWCKPRYIILKPPILHADQTLEKGVLLIKFTTTFIYFAREINCELLTKFFYIVLEPSWSGYCLPEIHFWNRYADAPVIIQSSEESDYAYIEHLQTNLIPVSFGSGDWVDERIFHPLENTNKKYDAIYIAGYTLGKRHHKLLKAIYKIKSPFKLALVCTSWGKHKDDIHRLIDHYELRDKIDIYEELPAEEVNIILNQSKVNVLLSLKEGSNKSIFEGFFANVPGIVLKNNIGVHKQYLNAQTGSLIKDSHLGKNLLYYKSQWQNHDCRNWAIQNISPAATTQKLEAKLRDIAAQKNETWTKGLVTKVNSPEAIYYDEHYSSNKDYNIDINALFCKAENLSYKSVAAIILKTPEESAKT